jgi:hypothetical protein
MHKFSLLIFLLLNSINLSFLTCTLAINVPHLLLDPFGTCLSMLGRIQETSLFYFVTPSFEVGFDVFLRARIDLVLEHCWLHKHALVLTAQDDFDGVLTRGTEIKVLQLIEVVSIGDIECPRLIGYSGHKLIWPIYLYKARHPRLETKRYTWNRDSTGDLILFREAIFR